MSTWLGLALTVLLLGANAFFVGAEFALISARRSQIEPRAEAGSKRAAITLRAMERVSLMMAGAQLGITVCSLLLGALSEPAIAHLIEDPLTGLGMPEALVHPVAFAIALTLVTLAHVILGEMVPKNIALAGPERAALVLAPILSAVVWVLHPVVWVLNKVANAVLRALRVTPKEEVASVFTRDEVAGLIHESQQSGMIDEREGELLIEALEFEEFKVGSVMIPAGDVVTLHVGITPEQAEEVAREGFSRFPVEDEEGLVGYVHIKDLLAGDDAARTEPIASSLVRMLPEVGPDQYLREVLSTMQSSGAHLAAVKDGERVVGIVTLEDVLTELVGQIRHGVG